MSKRLTTDEFVRRSILKHGDGRYDYSDSWYVNAHEKIKIICPGHGLFLQVAWEHLNGAGCRKCGSDRAGASKKLGQEEFISKCAEIHDGRYDYSDTVYTFSRNKIKIGCPDHGSFEQKANHHISGVGCPFCAGRVKPTQNEFVQRARERHSGKYTYEKSIYVNARTKLEITCPIHGSFWQTPHGHLHEGYNCPPCVGRKSEGQRDVESFVADLGFAHFVRDSRDILSSKKELDIYIESHKLAIEYNGKYHHSLTAETVGKYKNNHLKKFTECEELGIRLLQIDEHEWKDEAKGTIWRSIISSRLGTHRGKIFARKTSFGEIDSKTEAIPFLKKNHLQGGTTATARCFGLKLDGELVGVITFAAHGSAIGLTRLAFPIGVTIPGGAEKLFKNAIKLLPPEVDIVTFSNNRYSSGAIYTQLGFELDGKNPPSHLWVIGNEVLSKQKCRHVRLPKLLAGLGKSYDPDKTEHENMFAAGARCLYDAGKNRWIFRRSVLPSETK